MATREEADSTRGRANALRMAISGQISQAGLQDPGLYQVLDLCLECKACKSECPTGVDMARLKSEFLYHYQKTHGTPLRTRLLGSAERAAVWGTRLAPLSNWVTGIGPARKLTAWALGLSPERKIPQAERHTFLRWWTTRAPDSTLHATVGAAPAQELALFADTFTNHYEPRLGKAAVRFAEKLGYRVSVPARVCCGRPQISKGLLLEARRKAEDTVRILAPIAASGTPIVFCEPGCYSAVRDDHPLLLRGELREMAEVVANACQTFEEWADTALVRMDSSAGGGRSFAPGPERVLLHAHCHQKALGGLPSALKLLGRLPDTEVSDADAGCCGMAGSFGYEQEHYPVSRAVGERKLFPAVRSATSGTLIVAPGFSCRQQIRHFTGVEAVTVPELMEGLMI
jgi:Fe-S oxidoreductase